MYLPVTPVKKWHIPLSLVTFILQLVSIFCLLLGLASVADQHVFDRTLHTHINMCIHITCPLAKVFWVYQEGIRTP